MGKEDEKKKNTRTEKNVQKSQVETGSNKKKKVLKTKINDGKNG